jgi:hypothetical protein
VERLDTERTSVQEWTLGLDEPLPGTAARARADASPRLLDEEMSLFRAAQAQA